MKKIFKIILEKLEGIKFALIGTTNMNFQGIKIKPNDIDFLTDDENIKKGLALGAVDYFVKTQHSVYEVIEKVQKYLQKK